MLYTVADARSEVNRFVEAGMCTDGSATLEWINRAVRRLMEIAPTQYTKRRVRMRVQNDTVVLPRNAQKLLAVNKDGIPTRIWSDAYEFMDGGPGDLVYNGGCDDMGLVDLGDAWPIWYEIPATHSPMKVIALSTSENDVGLEMTIRGNNSSFEEIFTSGIPGEVLKIERWMRGEEGNLSESLMTGSTNQFNDISSITKPVTTGYITLMAYNAVTDGLWILAKYHPKETVPSFRRYKIPGISSDSGCQSWISKICQSWISKIKTWAAGIYFGIGEYCIYNSNYYRCVYSGYAGDTAPVHSSGEASDGVCSWVWVSEAALTASYSFSCSTCIYGLIKIRFIPLVYDTEILPVQSLDAIKDMVISLREEENGNIDASRAYYMQALSFLNQKEGDVGQHEYTIQIQVSPEYPEINMI